MGWHEWLVLWCAVWGAAALVGVGMSLAGLTKAQRTVRLTGRIERVRAPRHGGSRLGGISVVVSYRDPASGQEVTVTNDGERGEMITAAWEGREIGVSHPRGRPHAYRFSNAPEQPSRGLGRPAFALFLVYVGLVVLVAIDRGWPWALIGSGGPPAILGAVQLPWAVRVRNNRLDRLTAMETVPGRVVAVLKDISVDQDDGPITTITPVVSFTTHQGTAVTAHCTSHLPHPAGAYDRDVTVHYTAADPADFTLDRAAEHHSEKLAVAIHALAVALLAATAVAGAVLLRR
ncbi:DUF3592 domain-containing protein [Kitasatospora sp. CB01950]|uniref:DUF3592 domain-containing protein n=1 Tax=Kitasatospora sp. CB01950 TaxID=1703930 RepID=UPI00093A10E3|nr:DUF3592 domain-containing protein [Kitasatospora sp. CB01950]OKJ13674.1 hypothetical protein AMK19_09520 [Kitasatospora sp. CB01950]